jgi:D-3-phosphoglycerate dehydrogenase
VAAAASDADALLVQYADVDEDALRTLERCRGVVRYGVGVDSVDVDAATRLGVWVVNVPDYGVEEVSDHALALVLGLLRGVVILDRAAREGRWDHAAAGALRRLSTRTVGVLGCGRIGSAFALKARALGFDVRAYDPLGIPEAVRAAGVEAASFEEVLEGSDAISLHVPLTRETRHLIDAGALGRMRAEAFVVNTSRGGVVDGAALRAALDEGRLGGAALDVLETEPPDPDDALVRHERVVVTPHAAWYSEESALTLKTEAAREAVRVVRGERPRSPVNEPREPRGDA